MSDAISSRARAGAPRASDEAAPSTAPTRRAALALAGAGVAAGALAACGAKQEEQAAAQQPAPLPAAPEITVRGDNTLGDPGAPVTVIEYASITCPHCKAWHDEVFPQLKARYIDTGKVRFVFRELPTGPEELAMAGFLLARCAPEHRYFDALDQLFDKQLRLFDAYENGAARQELVEIGKSVGVPEERFDACMRNPVELARIQQVGEDGDRLYGVGSTPTFVIDGQTYEGETPFEVLAQIIDPLLPSAD